MTTTTGAQDLRPELLRRLPMPLMLMVAPLLGLAFVIFLPFIGFAAVLVLAASKAREAVDAVAPQLGWVRRPRLATLTAAEPTKPEDTDGANVQDAAGPDNR